MQLDLPYHRTAPSKRTLLQTNLQHAFASLETHSPKTSGWSLPKQLRTWPSASCGLQGPDARARAVFLHGTTWAAGVQGSAIGGHLQPKRRIELKPHMGHHGPSQVRANNKFHLGGQDKQIEAGADALKPSASHQKLQTGGPKASPENKPATDTKAFFEDEPSVLLTVRNRKSNNDLAI